jgi:hypothetical protein
MIAGVAVAASAANAQFIMTHTFDISGLVVDGGFGANFPGFTHDFGSAGTVIGVDIDVSYETNPGNISWISEANFAVDTTDDASLDGDIAAADFGGAIDAPGAFAFTAGIGANSLSSDGLVFLTVYDSFNDAGFDFTVLQGSVTVTFDAVVPAPASAGLLGLGGLVAARRRRA